MSNTPEKLEVVYTTKQLFDLAVGADFEQFQALSVTNQAMVVVVTKKIIDKLKRLDIGRRAELQKNLPPEGIESSDFSVKWQTKPGRWLVDEEELAKLYPDKVVKVTTQQLDPIFVEDYLNRAKKTKAGQPLPPCISYICNDEKTMVVRNKVKKQKG